MKPNALPLVGSIWPVVWAISLLGISVTQAQPQGKPQPSIETSPNGLYESETNTYMGYWKPAQKLQNHFHIEGFWRPEPNTPERANVFPSKTDLTCDKGDKVCTEWDAGIVTPGKPGMAELNLESTEFNIVSWDAASIVARNVDEECHTHTLIVDFDAQTVTVSDTPKNQTHENCKAFKDVNTYVLKIGSVFVNLNLVPEFKK
jgi:hypothetical protein